MTQYSHKKQVYTISGLLLASFLLAQGQTAQADQVAPELENRQAPTSQQVTVTSAEQADTVQDSLEVKELPGNATKPDQDLPAEDNSATSAPQTSQTAPQPEASLTAETSQQIAQGSIHSEDGKLDTSLYGQASLAPEADDDQDGIPNKDEIYIYKKGNQEFLGYHSHPKLEDSDGDGIPDKTDQDKLKWNVSDRDLAMFMELSYRDDLYIDRVLDEKQPLLDLYDGRHEYAIMHRELAPFWQVKKTYHTDSGFDAVLFETHSRFSYLPDKTAHVLAIRGTERTSIKDLANDAVILTGNNPKQAIDVENIMREITRDRSIQNFYITGHSLGGYLAQRATVELYQHYPDFYKQKFRSTSTFNALKVITARTIWNANNGLWDKGLESKHLAKQGKITNYITNNDLVLGNNLRNDDDVVVNLGNSPFGHGSRYYVNVLFKTDKYQENFNIGKRNYQNIDGYQDAQLTSLNFIAKPAKVITPTRKQIQTLKHRGTAKPKKNHTSKVVKKVRYPHR